MSQKRSKTLLPGVEQIGQECSFWKTGKNAYIAICPVMCKHRVCGNSWEYLDGVHIGADYCHTKGINMLSLSGRFIGCKRVPLRWRYFRRSCAASPTTALPGTVYCLLKRPHSDWQTAIFFEWGIRHTEENFDKEVPQWLYHDPAIGLRLDPPFHCPLYQYGSGTSRS